jgi:hypothetical protein
MKFRITLPEDGRELVGDVPLPDISIEPGSLPLPEAAGAAVAAALIPSIAAQIEPHLPPAAPARKGIERDAEGRVIGTVEYPAVPQPAIRANEIASRLAPGMARQYGEAIRAKYASIAGSLAEQSRRVAAEAAETAAKQASERAALQAALVAEQRAAVQTAAIKRIATVAASRVQDVATRLSRLERGR